MNPNLEEEKVIKYTYSLPYIILSIITILSIALLLIYTFNQIKEIEQIRNPPVKSNVIWYYSCPDYVSDYYNCNSTRFENMTGKYCGIKLTCENKYKLIN